MTLRDPALLALALLAAASPARADGPSVLYKDTERFGPTVDGGWYGGRALPPGHAGLPTRWDGGPGYVGSDWGLGRPAYTGLGSRPDWGRSNID